MNLKRIWLLRAGVFILLVTRSFEVSSQTTSFGFAEAVPPKAETVKAVDGRYFGVYKNENNVQYVFNETGVFTVSNIMSSISREKVRESSKYMVRGDYLFGIEEGDSTRYVLRDDRYYFGIESKTRVIGKGLKNKLTKSGNVYYINFYEDGNYYPSRVVFSADGLSLSHFDYPNGTDMFSVIEKSKKEIIGDLLKISLFPSAIEWKKLPLYSVFPIASTFKKQNG